MSNSSRSKKWLFHIDDDDDNDDEIICKKKTEMSDTV